MIELQFILTMVMFVNVDIHSTNIQCLWEKFKFFDKIHLVMDFIIVL
jgi:hypothetical protein